MQSVKRKIVKKISEHYLYNAGLHYLQRYASSIENFRRIMDRKIIRSCTVHENQNIEDCRHKLENVIARFVELGYLNDYEYARIKIRFYRGKGFSYVKIINALAQKGISKDLAENIINNLDSDVCSQNMDIEKKSFDPELAAALKLCRRKKIGIFSQKEDKNMQKDLAYLARNGFSYDISRKVLEISGENACDILENTGIFKG